MRNIYDIKPNGMFDAKLEGIIHDTITAGQTKEIDFQMTYDRVINGIQYQAPNRNLGDNIDFEIHHPTEGLLKWFGKNWYTMKEETITLYGAFLPAGVLIKVRYKNVGVNDVEFVLGAYFHEYQ